MVYSPRARERLHDPGRGPHDRRQRRPAARLSARRRARRPRRGTRGELRFSFQDLLLLRKAEGLVSQRIPPHRVRRALRQLRERLTDERPLTGVQLGTEGPRSSSTNGARAGRPSRARCCWRSSGGARRAAKTPLVALPMRPPAGSRRQTATSCRRRSRRCTSSAAIWTKPIPSAPKRATARCWRRRPSTPTRTSTWAASCTSAATSRGAEAHYRRALAVRPNDATADFNLGVALEDQGRHAEALEAYQRAIAADDTNADAHYNAARLYDLLGDYGAALRHLRICRDLARQAALTTSQACAADALPARPGRG